MTQDNDRRGYPAEPDRQTHEKFLELCAVSTTGELSEREHEVLRDHLAACAECRQALQEFQAAADLGMPLLVGELAGENAFESKGNSAQAAKAALTVPMKKSAGNSHPRTAWGNGQFGLARPNGGGSATEIWKYGVLAVAAGLLLAAGVGLYSYRAGKRSGTEVAQETSKRAGANAAALERRISDLSHQREILDTQLAGRDRRIDDMEGRIRRESASLSEAEAAQGKLEAALQGDEAGKKQAAEERSALGRQLDAVTAQLHDARASFAKSQAQLSSLQQQRTQEALHAQDFTEQIQGLTAQLQGQERTILQQQDLLAKDRDIRDLMAARNLYIAEVYDVARNGTTRKPFGRIFYTKGKSLIFYAYDLEQQPGITQASAFQAWGQSGEQQQALDLGIFYQDSAAKKRWVLRVDNPRTLQKIDAVFVTVEPRGGSRRPTGKRLLYAFLKVAPNHP